eukprot:m.70818 g.70818  ORF g.70818 m.70818 type:complete len:107 (-) comp13792_c1_seq1:494-814(-)
MSTVEAVKQPAVQIIDTCRRVSRCNPLAGQRNQSHDSSPLREHALGRFLEHFRRVSSSIGRMNIYSSLEQQCLDMLEDILSLSCSFVKRGLTFIICRCEVSTPSHE